MPSSSSLYFERARVGSLSRDRKPDDPELIEAKRNLRALALEGRVKKVLAGEPRLSRDQIERIVALLRAGGEH